MAPVLGLYKWAGLMPIVLAVFMGGKDAMWFISPRKFINVDAKVLEQGPAIHTGELNTIYATAPDLPLALVETEGLTVGRQLTTQPGLTSVSWIDLIFLKERIWSLWNR